MNDNYAKFEFEIQFLHTIMDPTVIVYVLSMYIKFTLLLIVRH